MKTKVRIFAVFAAVVLVFAALCIPSHAMSEECLYDGLSIFTESQAAELRRTVFSKYTSSSAGVKIVTHSGALLSESQYLSMTNSSYAENVAIFVVRKNGAAYNYDLFTFGTVDSAVSEKESERILDAAEVYDNIKSGAVYEGVVAFLPLCAKAIEGRLRAPFYSYLLPCAVIALIAVLVTVITIRSKYKTKLKAPSYPLDRFASLRLITANDILIDTVVTRVKINTNSGSGGSSGGGRSGGGGHRGGR